MNILITGSSGYLGQHVVRQATARGHSVQVASRNKPSNTENWRYFDLNSEQSFTLENSIEAVLHLAANVSPSTDESINEINTAKKLLIEAERIGAKFIYTSSQTASENAPTIYGRTKWQIEQEVLAKQQFVARIGQVYGGLELGLFGQINQLIRRLPILPAFIPSPMIQPIHIDDCADALLSLAEMTTSSQHIYNIASPEPVSFTTFLRKTARYQVGVKRWFIPIPTFLINGVCMITGPTSAAHRLRSLFMLPTLDSKADLLALKQSVRSLNEGLAGRSVRNRRRLIHEAFIVLSYILSQVPRYGVVSRYVRFIEGLDQSPNESNKPLPLPGWTAKWPTALALFDRNFKPQSPLAPIAWRIDAATMIAEASPQGARQFLPVSPDMGRLAAAWSIVSACITDILWRTLSWFVIPYYQRSLSQRANNEA